MINLVKGQREPLATGKYLVGLSWDATTTVGSPADLDVSAFVLTENLKLAKDENFVFYNNLKSPSGLVEHTGDNLTGEGDGDDEVIKVDLSKAEPTDKEITFVVTIHEAATRGQNFGQVKKASIRVVNADTNEEVLKYDLEEDFSVETAVEFGKLTVKDGQWKFVAVGTGRKGGLADYLAVYQ